MIEGEHRRESWDVVGIGENSVDYVHRLPFYPQPDSAQSKVRITSSTVQYGGQVATALSACVALGASATYFGVFGDDDAGRGIRAELRARGVDVSHAVTRNAPTRTATILIDDRTGERVVLWQRDERLRLEDDEIDESALRSARLLHVDAVDERLAIRAARLARDAGMIVTCDVDTPTAETRELIDTITLPILAEHVATGLTGAADDITALRRLQRPHHRMLCVTRGERGALLLVGNEMLEVPGHRVRVVDSTGAGDVFRGAFIAALLRDRPPAGILRFANIAAALSCTRAGALGGVPTRDEVEAAMRASA